MTAPEIRDGWHQVITVFPKSLSTVAYRYESGGWWLPDLDFNEASLVGAKITPLYTQAEVDEIRQTQSASSEISGITDEQVERTARMLFARTHEGRNGFSWPLNGAADRERDLRDARRFLTRAIGTQLDADQAAVEQERSR